MSPYLQPFFLRSTVPLVGPRAGWGLSHAARKARQEVLKDELERSGQPRGGVLQGGRSTEGGDRLLICGVRRQGWSGRQSPEHEEPTARLKTPDSSNGKKGPRRIPFHGASAKAPPNNYTGR